MIPLALGYCETHFRFGGISPSFLFRKSPEILFDMPARLAPNQNLPIVLLLNNIHRYPVDVISVEFAITASHRSVEKVEIITPDEYEKEHPFSFRAALYHFEIDRTLLADGWNSVLAKVVVRERGKEKTILVDNFVTSSNRPLSVFVASNRFPGTAVHYGDLHCHSIHSWSHVEFGAPLQTIQTMGEASGLSFTAVTDHSYDLECSPQNYLYRDQSLANWKIQQEGEVDSDRFTLLVGEEISGRRDFGGVVHCGALGHSSFVRGSGDGARKNYRRSEELSLQEAASQVIAENGITFAAHPGEKTSLLQRILLRRGNWVQSELTPNITALQGTNGRFDHFWYVARKLWVNALLEGKQIPLVAGNDAHGDFNRYRAMGFPFIYVKENFERYFGLARTGIYSESVTKEIVLDSIKAGRTFITDGAFASITCDDSVVVGETCNRDTTFEIHAKSNSEFGALLRVNLFVGIVEKSKELVYRIPTESNSYCCKYTIPSDSLTSASYIRLEVDTDAGERKFPTKAVTSAVYLR